MVAEWRSTVRFSERDEQGDHRHQLIERVKVAGRAVHPLSPLGNFLANRTYLVTVPANESAASANCPAAESVAHSDSWSRVASALIVSIDSPR
jgi:hypothetical protein